MAGLYIHIPFCVGKCFYCDFVSIPAGYYDMNPYVDALCAEAEQRVHEMRDQIAETVYVGGGTPTMLGADRLARILVCVRAYFCVAKDAEITVEANPGTVDAAQLRALRGAGINRLSLGVQSFDDAQLRTLGRLHTAREAEDAVRTARAAGFDNISIDVMYGLPGQTSLSLEGALALDVPHISLYALKLEEGTPLCAAADAGIIEVPDDDAQADMYDYAVETLRAHGYKRYEVSNFARPGYESRHNSGYWRRTPYMGLGAAAHSLIGSTRYSNMRSIEEYCARALRGEDTRDTAEHLTCADMDAETLMLGLRMEDGVDISALPLPRGTLDTFIRQGFMELSGNILRLTDKGFPVMNALLVELL